MHRLDPALDRRLPQTLRQGRFLAGLAALILLATACSSTEDTSEGTAETDETEEAVEDTVRSFRIPNHGGDLEGHTPRGFAGSGTGLFTGDNLNPDFPNGEGIQILLTFELPDDIDQIRSASLSSVAMEVRGDPFGALGPLQAEPVTYEEFGPPLFELEADGEPVDCLRVGNEGVICDVSEAAAAGVAEGKARLQFRLQFVDPSDSDGEQDLALFYLTDTNTNEPGIFFLNVED